MLLTLSEDIYNYRLSNILMDNDFSLTKEKERSHLFFKERFDAYLTCGFSFSAQIICMRCLFGILVKDASSGNVSDSATIKCAGDVDLKSCMIKPTYGTNMFDMKGAALFISYVTVWLFLRPTILQASRLSLIGGECIVTEKNKFRLSLKLASLSMVALSQAFVTLTTLWIISLVSFRATPAFDTLLEGIGILNEIDDIASYVFLKGKVLPFKHSNEKEGDYFF